MKRSSVLILLLAAAIASGCGSDDDGPDDAGINPTESAFLKAMIPHHESAVEMAKIAQEEGQHSQIKKLADAIIEDQEAEIAKMEQIYERLTGEEIAPDPVAHQELGLSAKAAGMHDESMSMLDQAMKEFDREFIDAMIPHHQGAVRMARIVLADSGDDEIRHLAGAIVTAQSREIKQMNEWRQRWYGAASPAGGVPSEGETLPPVEADDHDSGH